MDDYLPNLLILVLSVNLILFFGQLAIADIAPTVENDQNPSLYDVRGSLLCQFDTNACNGTTHVLPTDQAASQLPSSEAVTAGDGSLFTDMFNSIKSFFVDTLGFGYITDLLAAPYNFISILGLPDAFTWGVAALWYGFTLFIIVAFFWGR